MSIIRRIFIITIFVLSFSLFTNAQDIAYYLFLETVDFNGKPVQSATVDFPNFNWRDKTEEQRWYYEAQTDESGKVRTIIPNPWFELARSSFRVTKSGYYPFFDLGTEFNRPLDNIYKLELLKIPQTDEEIKLLGKEQLKREFMWAARDGDSEKVRQFIKSGISPNLNTNDLRGVYAPKNIPAIMYAAASGNGETVEIFLKSKAKVRQAETSEHSLINYYLKSPPFGISYKAKPSNEEWAKAFEKYEKGINLLIKAGARIENLDKDSSNALMLAVRYGYTNIAKTFLQKGLLINAKNNKGETALYYTNPYHHTETIKFLLEAGADPNIIPDNNCNVFFINAVSSNNIEVVKLLIKHKVNVNYSCPNSKSTPLKAANSQEIKNLIIEAGAK